MIRVDPGVLAHCLVGGVMVAVPMLSMIFTGYSAVRWMRAPRST